MGDATYHIRGFESKTFDLCNDMDRFSYKVSDPHADIGNISLGGPWTSYFKKQMVIYWHRNQSPVIDIMQGRAVSTAALDRHTPGHPGYGDNDGSPDQWSMISDHG